MSVKNLRANRTRTKNVLTNKLQECRGVADGQPDPHSLVTQLRTVRQALALLPPLLQKHEDAHEKLADALGDGEEQDLLQQEVQEGHDLSLITAEYLARLQVLEGEIVEQLKRMEGAEVQPLPQPNNGQAAAMVRLPKLELQAFSGDVLRWSEFWDAFESSVDRQNIPAVQKFNHLKGNLSGDAASTIAGLAVTNANYTQAVNLLKERFGNQQKIINAHYSALMSVPVAQGQIQKLRQSYDKIEKHLRSLEALGHDVESPVFATIILSKLPFDVKQQMGMQRDMDEDWSVRELRESLKKYITVTESSVSTSQQSGRSDVAQSSQLPKKMQSLNLKSSAEALMVSEGQAGRKNYKAASNQRQSGPRVGCKYCSKSHWSDECSEYSTVQARKNRIKGSCFNCLQKGHQLKDCPIDRWCYYCKKVKQHHRSLCPQRFPSGQAEVAHLAQEEKKTEPELEVLSAESQPEGSMLASGEKVLMQTALVKLVNLHGSKSASARLLLDCGSARTYITYTLAKKLNLPMKGSDQISVLTFGSPSPKHIQTKTTQLQLTLGDGSLKKISANVVPKITGSIERHPVDLGKDSFLFKSFYMADSMPTESESTSIELLIGNDYYLDLLIMDKKLVEIQEGLYLLPTKLGFVLSGRVSGQGKAVEPTLMNFVQGQMPTESKPELSLISGPGHSSPHAPVAGESPAGSINFDKMKSPETSPFGIEEEKCSSLEKLVRTTAWAQRFVDKLRKVSTAVGPLSTHELLKSRQLWERYVQASHFKDVFECLKTGKRHCLVQQLGLQIDDKGVIRCHVRFKNAELSENARKPKLLPKGAHFSHLIVDANHKALLHAGISETLASIRQKNWLPQGCSEVRKVLNHCTVCQEMDVLLRVRERTQHSLKEARSTVPTEPAVGDVVLLKENLPRGSWKMGRVQQLHTSNDGNVRSATISVPNQRVLNRPLNLLFPIECPAREQVANSDATLTEAAKPLQPVPSVSPGSSSADSVSDVLQQPATRPIRQAALKARAKLKQWLNADSDDE